jgi:Flp pilus assembly protein CpaB
VRQDIAAGQPITSSQLTQGLSTYLKPGTRAFTLTLNMIANGSSPTVQPGDMIDLYAMQPGVDGGPATATLLQTRVQVLAYAGQSLDGPDTGLAQSVVLGVPADKVDALLQAEGPGRIAVAVSRAEDEAPTPASALAATPAPAAPQAQAAAPRPPAAASAQPAAAQTQPVGAQARSVAEQAQAVANQAQVVARQAQTVAKQAQSVVQSHVTPAAKPAEVKHAARESRRDRVRARERGRTPAKPQQTAAKPAPASAVATPAAVAPAPAPVAIAPASRSSAAQGVEGIPLLRAPLTQSFNAPAAH